MGSVLSSNELRESPKIASRYFFACSGRLPLRIVDHDTTADLIENRTEGA
jgi:hypothetical protein